MYKLLLEDRLSFVDIHYKSEDAVIQLDRIKKRKYYKKSFLKESLEIVDCCDTVLNCFPPYFFENPPYIYFQILLKGSEGLIKKGYNSNKIISEVQNIKLTLEKITKKEKISSEEIGEGINFFLKLSHKCIEYLNINSQI